MQNVTMDVILNYIWEFAIIWLLCFLGCFLRDVKDTVKNDTKVNYIKILLSTIFVSIVLAVFFVYVKLEFQFIVLICFVSGVYAIDITNCIFDTKKILIFVKNIFKNISNPITKGVADSIVELKAIEEKENATKSANTNNNNKDSDG